jgi:ferredoxin
LWREKKPIVKNANNCVVFCIGCEGQCPEDAISFPSKQKTREVIKKLRLIFNPEPKHHSNSKFNSLLFSQL